MRKQLIFVFSLVILVLTSFAVSSPSITLKSDKQQNNTLACDPESLSGNLELNERIGYFEGSNISVSDLAMIPDKNESDVLGVAKEERWVEVDLSEQKLMAWEGDTLYLETPISSGLPHTPTPTGEFRVWIKLRATRMEGGQGAYYYNLPNVPYVMYFGNDQVPNSRGFGLHGTYWHNDFGNPRSHGCVNLPTPIAKEIYEWSAPILPQGKTVVRSTNDNPGMRIVIHE